MPHILLIDDIRDTEADIVCRTYEGAMNVLNKIWLEDWVLLLDHDLGGEKTGYDLINHVIESNNFPLEIQIVSSNPVGRDNIGRALDSTGRYKRKSPHLFRRVCYGSDT